eukprot:186849-Rhodomonas_salina.1
MVPGIPRYLHGDRSQSSRVTGHKPGTIAPFYFKTNKTELCLPTNPDFWGCQQARTDSPDLERFHVDALEIEAGAQSSASLAP